MGVTNQNHFRDFTNHKNLKTHSLVIKKKKMIVIKKINK